MKRTVTLHRRIPLSGALLRVTLEPCGEGARVRIVKLERKAQGSSRFQRLRVDTPTAKARGILASQKGAN